MDACKEMIDGFSDGYDAGNPEPGPNRSACYRHGFENGRDDINHNPRSTAQDLRDEADCLMRSCGCSS